MHRGYRAEAILELATKTFRDELLPALPGDKRYLGAMLASALDVAKRQLTSDFEASDWALLDPIYGEGEGSIKMLAGDIRARRVSTQTHADLAKQLSEHVKAELALRNPRFLNSRED